MSSLHSSCLPVDLSMDVTGGLLESTLERNRLVTVGRRNALREIRESIRLGGRERVRHG